LDGSAYGYSSVGGSGHRSRYAGTAELRMPVLDSLTLNASGRYDNFNVAGGKVDKATFNLGVEYRPVKSVLLRGRYGTAFKAPTLADEFQGQSGFFQTVTDYYLCEKAGYVGNTLGRCPQVAQTVSGVTSGNPQLKPITAKVWDMGVVWHPVDQLQVSFDVISWDIHDEVGSVDTTRLLETEAQCRLGQLDITSPTCVAALAEVTRGGASTGNNIISIYEPKLNVAQETDRIMALEIDYKLETAGSGSWVFSAYYTDLLKHDLVQFPGDPVINDLTDPTFSTEFKSKVNASATWSLEKLSATLYGEYYGKTPNYAATVSGYGTPGAQPLNAWALLNASVRYQLTPGLVVAAEVSNIFDQGPPPDHSYPGSQNIPPYNQQNYTALGRGYYLQAIYKIGK